MYTQKTAGWRHLPAILGAVRDNFVNHTLPGIRASRAVHRFAGRLKGGGTED